MGFNKTSIGNYFIYSDYAPAALSAAAESRALRASPGGPAAPLENGWNACVMSYATQAMPTDLTDVWANNTCITKDARAFFAFNSCHKATPLDGSIPLFSNNKWAADTGNWTMACDKTEWTLAEAQALGVDVGSVVIAVPTTAEIIAAGRALLLM